EAAHETAQVARVEAEVPAEVGGRRLPALGQLVEDADLGEGEGAPEEALLQDADLAGVEPVEPADGGDLLPGGLGHGPPSPAESVNQSVDRVKYVRPAEAHPAGLQEVERRLAPREHED